MSKHELGWDQSSSKVSFQLALPSSSMKTKNLNVSVLPDKSGWVYSILITTVEGQLLLNSALFAPVKPTSAKLSIKGSVLTVSLKKAAAGTWKTLFLENPASAAAPSSPPLPVPVSPPSSPPHINPSRSPPPVTALPPPMASAPRPLAAGLPQPGLARSPPTSHPSLPPPTATLPPPTAVLPPPTASLPPPVAALPPPIALYVSPSISSIQLPSHIPPPLDAPPPRKGSIIRHSRMRSHDDGSTKFPAPPPLANLPPPIITAPKPPTSALPPPIAPLPPALVNPRSLFSSDDSSLTPRGSRIPSPRGTRTSTLLPSPRIAESTSAETGGSRRARPPIASMMVSASPIAGFIPTPASSSSQLPAGRIHPSDALAPALPPHMQQMLTDSSSPTTSRGSRIEPLPEDSSSSDRHSVDDMVQLPKLTQESILFNIQDRFKQDVIYTNIGSVLVAINPYRMIPGLYDLDKVIEYTNARINTLPPHIFSIADAAFTALLDTGRNQSVVISGESGAGKTEAAKLILQFITSRSASKSTVETVLLHSSPVLEAFGNATTVRNDNSSRFGKYMEIFISKKNQIQGGKIAHYLLEKSRICTHTQGERNYHIFYQLCAGAPQQLREKLFLGESANNFRFLNIGGHPLKVEQDALAFENTSRCLQEIFNYRTWNDASFAKQKDKNQNWIQEIWSTVAAILHLGNVEFTLQSSNTSAGNIDAVYVSNPEVLERAANLLSLSPAVLNELVTTRKNVIRNEQFSTPLNLNQATSARDYICKEIYSALFSSLVDFINAAILPKEKSLPSIGILDIFGFENFAYNSYEQFAINLANEKFLHWFNEQFFINEEALYNREGISCPKFPYKDNDMCMELLEGKKPMGITSILEDESKIATSTDNSFYSNLSQMKHKKLEINPRTPGQFIVQHYAGNVTYHTQGWLMKNSNQVLVGFHDWIKSSSSLLIKSLPFAAAPAKGKNPNTVMSGFQQDLVNLLTLLTKTNGHYIRALKPNGSKRPNRFDAGLVSLQLRNTGILETIRIRQLGFPVRFTFSEFYEKYRLLASPIPPSILAKRPPQSRGVDQSEFKGPVRHLMNSLLQDHEDTNNSQIGRSRVFMKDILFGQLEDAFESTLHQNASVIQAFFQGIHQRRRYLKMKASAIRIQTAVRRWIARRQYMAVRQATLFIQSRFRMKKIRNAFLQQQSQIISQDPTAYQTKVTEMKREAVQLLLKSSTNENQPASSDTPNNPWAQKMQIASTLANTTPDLERLPTVGKRPTATVLYDLQPTRKGDLPLTKGETIEILSQDSSWWKGCTSDGTIGIFPSNYVQLDSKTSTEGEEAATPGAASYAGVSPSSSSSLITPFTRMTPALTQSKLVTPFSGLRKTAFTSLNDTSTPLPSSSSEAQPSSSSSASPSESPALIRTESTKTGFLVNLPSRSCTMVRTATMSNIPRPNQPLVTLDVADLKQVHNPDMVVDTPPELAGILDILVNKKKLAVEQLFTAPTDSSSSSSTSPSTSQPATSGAPNPFKLDLSSAIKKTDEPNKVDPRHQILPAPPPLTRQLASISAAFAPLSDDQFEAYPSDTILNEDESVKFQWLDYTRECFQRQTRKVAFKTVLVSWNMIVSYQSVELTDSLHPFTEKQRKKSAQLQEQDDMNRAMGTSVGFGGMMNEWSDLLKETGGEFPSEEEYKAAKTKLKAEREAILAARALRKAENNPDEADTKINKEVKAKEEEALLKAAVQNFETILMYQLMEEIPNAEKLNSTQLAKVKRVRLLRAIKAVQFLQLNGIRFPKLRDEIYCQVVKQTRNCPKEELEKRAWQLLAVITGVFSPSTSFLPYFIAFLHLSMKDWREYRKTAASWCLHRVQRTYANGDRRHPMGPDELDATLRMVDFTIPVELPDGTSKQIPVDSSTIYAELFPRLSRKVRLRDNRGWSIFEVFDKLERSLNPNDLVADEFAKIQSYEAHENANALSDQKEELASRGFKFLFKKKLHLDPHRISADETENRLLFFQTSSDFVDGKLPCSDDQALMLGALLAQIEGDYTPKIKTPEELEAEALREQQIRTGIYDAEVLQAIPLEVDLNLYLPQSVIHSSEQKDEKAWEKDLIELHKTLKGVTSERCQSVFLLAAKRLPLFGTTLYNVTHKSSWDMPARLGLAVSIEGLHFVDPVDGFSILKEIPLKDILRWSVDVKGIIIAFDPTSKALIHTDKKLPMLTAEAVEIASVIRNYTDWLKLESEWCRAVRDYYGGDGSGLLSFNMGDMIQIKTRRSDGFWFGTLADGTSGLFPSDAVEVIIMDLDSDVPLTSRPAQPPPVDENATPQARRGTATAEEQALQATQSGLTITRDRFASTKIKRIDTTKFTMRTFATSSMFRTMRTMRTGTFRTGKKGGKEYNLEDRIQWQKEPLVDSLTLTKSEEYNKKAEELFIMVQKWMGDYPLKKSDTREGVIQTLIQAGIQHRKLRDEIYCQIVKQSTENPSDESTRRGWHLLILTASCFLPSDAFARYLIGHIQDHKELKEGPLAHLAVLADECHERVARTIKRGARKSAPSLFEINSVVTAQPMYLKLSLVDGSQKTILLDSACIVDEILDELFTKLDLPKTQENREIYSIFLTCQQLNVDTHISSSENIPDRLRWIESYEVPKEITAPVWTFVFRRRFFFNPQSIVLADLKPIELHFAFWQTLTSILDSRHPTTKVEAAEMAAIHMQILFGDHEGIFKADTMDAYLPKRLIPLQSFEDWQFALLPFCAKHRGRPIRDLQMRYLEIARAWPCWGATSFFVRRQEKPHDAVLFIYSTGVHISLPGKRNPLSQWSYQEIASWTATPSAFCFRLSAIGSIQEYKVFTRQGEDIKLTIKTYVDRLIADIQSKKRREMVAKQRTRTIGGPSLLRPPPMKKGSGIVAPAPSSSSAPAPPPPSLPPPLVVRKQTLL